MPFAQIINSHVLYDLAFLLLVKAIRSSILSVDLPKKPLQLCYLALTDILPDLKDGEMRPDFRLAYPVAP